MPIAVPLIAGGAAIAGAGISAFANKKAADTAANAQIRAAELQTQYLREAQDKQLAFAREGQDYLKAARLEEGPGLSYLRTVVAGSGSLTPAQQAQLAELRRNVTNQVGTSSIAGSGRTAAALFKRAESDFTNDALARNRQSAIDAAGGMANRSGSYASGIGNISVGTGTQQAALSGQIGAAQGQGAANAGTIQGQGIAATGNMFGQTFGNVAGLINNGARQSRYGDMDKNINAEYVG